MNRLSRGLFIAYVVFRYGLHTLLLESLPRGRALGLLKWLLPAGSMAHQARGARLRMALEHLGPIFVKLGQVISTRRDLLPVDIADELAKLQDQVPPFDSDLAVAAIENHWANRLPMYLSSLTACRWPAPRLRRCTLA